MRVIDFCWYKPNFQRLNLMESNISERDTGKKNNRKELSSVPSTRGWLYESTLGEYI